MEGLGIQMQEPEVSLTHQEKGDDDLQGNYMSLFLTHTSRAKDVGKINILRYYLWNCQWVHPFGKQYGKRDP